MKVIFNADYTGKHGSHKAGQVRNISDDAFADLKSKGLVKIHREAKQEKELKEPAETKELKITRETK